MIDMVSESWSGIEKVTSNLGSDLSPPKELRLRALVRFTRSWHQISNRLAATCYRHGLVQAEVVKELTTIFVDF
jgi:hypothetical protein